MAPVEGVDPLDLASAGWGLILSPNASPEIREALSPLLDWRREQGGSLFKQFSYEVGQSADGFLDVHRAPPGPADPDYVPYYLLIVGNPSEVPLQFQIDLDVQYAVGRISFDTTDDYRSYAQGIVRAEKASQLRRKELALFGVMNEGDPWTQSAGREFIDGLGKKVRAERFGFDVRLLLGPQATKEQLGRLLGGEETPALLVTASHGVKFTKHQSLQISDQGALLCQEWPGPGWGAGQIPRGYYFSSEDVNADADLHGLIALLYSSFAGGINEQEDSKLSSKNMATISRLPQKLLAQGALAIVAPIGMVWTAASDLGKEGHLSMFSSLLIRLLKGHPVGSAMEYLNQRHAELAVKVGGMWKDRDTDLKASRDRFSRVWRAKNDSSNFIVLGDPAVRLAT